MNTNLIRWEAMARSESVVVTAAESKRWTAASLWSNRWGIFVSFSLSAAFWISNMLCVLFCDDSSLCVRSEKHGRIDARIDHRIDHQFGVRSQGPFAILSVCIRGACALCRIVALCGPPWIHNTSLCNSFLCWRSPLSSYVSESENNSYSKIPNISFPRTMTFVSARFSSIVRFAVFHSSLIRRQVLTSVIHDASERHSQL